MSFTWVFLSLFSAFTLATSDALTKKALIRSNEYLVAWFRLVFSLPLLIIIWFFIPRPDLDTIFYRAFLLALPLEILAIVLYIKALRVSPLSLTLPFLSLTPLFLIIVSYLILGEKVSLQGGLGIVFITAGSYTLNIHQVRKGVFKPFKAIVNEKGSVLMICVALIYSVTSSLGKMAIEHSSPLFFGVTYFMAVTALFAPIALRVGRPELKAFIDEKQFNSLFIPGLFYSLMIASHMIAISLTKVAYMISVKRTSILIGIVYGYFIFREKKIGERFLGAVLMFTGFVLIVTAS
ncbi:MAG: EamA family transporter [Nitrospirae bacterium]|jgi:drug/metabolite transporter (DMT)-like permease|nr:EamA family transporter [Nitrospirota bacterium]